MYQTSSEMLAKCFLIQTVFKGKLINQLLFKIWDYNMNSIVRSFWRPSSLFPTLKLPLNIGSE